jgi:hypothetical protein
VGSKTKWASEDLDATDMRAYELAYMEFGFDYGKIAFELNMGGSVELGARYGSLFRRTAYGVPRFGVRYQGNTWVANVFGGGADADDFSFQILRGNFEWQPNNFRKFAFSIMKRSASFDGTTRSTGFHFTTESEALAGAVYGSWRVRSRYWVGGELAVEQLKTSGSNGTTSDENSDVIPKFGVNGSISF